MCSFFTHRSRFYNQINCPINACAKGKQATLHLAVRFQQHDIYLSEARHVPCPAMSDQQQVSSTEICISRACAPALTAAHSFTKENFSMVKKTALPLLATSALLAATVITGWAQTPPPPDRGAPPPPNAAPAPPPDNGAPPPNGAPRRRGKRGARPAPPPDGNAPAPPHDGAPPPPPDGPPPQGRPAPPPPPVNAAPPQARAFAPGARGRMGYAPRPDTVVGAYGPGVIVGAQPRTIEGTVKYITPDGLVLKRGVFQKDTLVRFAPQVARQALPIVGVGDKVRVTGLAYKDDTGRTYLTASALTNRRTGISATAGDYAIAPYGAPAPPPKRGRRGAPPPPAPRGR
jgi:hypothetical protein